MVSCTLLGGRDRFLVPHGQRLVATLAHLIGQLTERGMQLVMPVITVVLQTIPEEGPTLLEPALRALLADIQGDDQSGVVIAGRSPPPPTYPSQTQTLSLLHVTYFVIDL